jgi:Uma2 family endonuclease
MTAPDLRQRRWTRVEYDRLIDAGVLQPGEPIELLGGLLVVAEPQGDAHFTAIRLAEDALRAAFGRDWEVRAQGPLALDAESEPEPDVAVVPGTPRDYRDGHPTHAALVVEVAESSLMSDREDKGGLYARAGIADYWIVNLVDRVVEIFREPVPDPTATFGWRYQSATRVGFEASVAPLAVLSSRIPVADLLP